MSDEYMTKAGCDLKHKETLAVLTEINNRLYKDNGNKSIQTRLNEHSNVIVSFQHALWILYGAIILSLIGAMANFWFTRTGV